MFKEPKFAIKSQTDFREYYSGKLIKQKQQSSKRTEERSRIFDGCVCYVNGFSTGKYSAHFIGNLIAENGGVFEIVGRSTKVTHWVCDSIPDGKANQEVITKRRKTRYYVMPEWVIDSVASNKRLPESKYVIPQFVPKDDAITRYKTKCITPSSQNKESKDVCCAVMEITNALDVGIRNTLGPGQSKPYVALNKNGIVVSSTISGIIHGMTQWQMALTLADKDASIFTINEKQISEVSQSVLQFCITNFPELDPRVIAHDIISFHCDKDKSEEPIASRLQKPIESQFPSLQFKIYSLNELAQLGLTWYDRKSFNAFSELGNRNVHNEVTKNLGRSHWAYANYMLGSKRPRSFYSKEEYVNDVSTPPKTSAPAGTCSRNFACNFLTFEELTSAVEAMVNKSIDMAKSKLEQDSWHKYTIKLALHWLERVERNRNTDESIVRKIIKYFLQVTKPDRIAAIKLQTRMFDRMTQVEISSQKQGDTVENTESKQRRRCIGDGVNMRLDFENYMEDESERQRNTLIKSESNEDEGIDICVLPEDLETKNGGAIDDEKQEYGLVKELHEPRSHPSRLSEIDPEVAENIPDDILQEIKDQLSRETTRPISEHKRALPTSVDEICPEIAKELPKHILEECKEELSRSSMTSNPSKQELSFDMKGCSTKRHANKSLNDYLTESNSGRSLDYMAKPRIVKDDPFKEEDKIGIKSGIGRFEEQSSMIKAIPTSLEEICPEIAKEIPPEILEECKNELSRDGLNGPSGARSSQIMPRTLSQVDPNVATALGSQIMRDVYKSMYSREESLTIEAEPKSQDVEIENCRYSKVNVDEPFQSIRQTLEAWLSSSDVASNSTRVSKISEYLDYFIEAGSLQTLASIMCFLNRTCSKSKLSMFYLDVKQHVQEHMKAKYGKELYIPSFEEETN